MTDAVLARFTENCCGTLTCINVSVCYSITDVGAAHLANCHKLTDVDLCNCRNVSGLGIATMVGGCPHIERLNVFYCKNVNDELLAKIAECCRRLKYFSTNSANISDAGILKFVANCPLLCDVNISCCLSVSKATKSQIELVCASRR